MKNFIITSIITFFTITLQAQQLKQLTNEDIWFSSKFLGESVRGVRSMQDGLHFTLLERDNGSSEINQYTFQDFEKVKTITSSTEINIAFTDYTFSADEKNCFLLPMKSLSIAEAGKPTITYMIFLMVVPQHFLTQHLESKD